MRNSTLLNLVKVKAEPLDSSELHKPGMSAAANLSLNIKSVKSEVNISAELNIDEVDDMQLQQRMKLRIPEKDSKSNTSDNFQCSGKGFPSVEKGPAVMQATNPIRISCPRKRKKTATDSIETALEEDAPGLLQVLIEQGVSIDEMKLYGETENDEPIDESFIEDGFADLEAVISKDYNHTYYPATLPLRRPNSGDLELLDEAEFGKAARKWSMMRTLSMLLQILDCWRNVTKKD
ncbi:uncharacterized protein LOC126670469 isoform X2 [Mercurialis annua]|uniref:uncharacterized protein LOC126670469 isoform X2 n=1 Tax=Mercurialis annua TaxID=3986 RepID=UPI00215F6B62|nr:uncharacterized protein LOC126670469 isoform X2 [Mercurialis annua]